MNREEDMIQKENRKEDETAPQEEQSQKNTEPSAPATPPPADNDSKLAEAEKQAAAYKDLFLRKAAEFDNFKRRTENETAQIIRYANEELLQEILPVVDDLERFLKNAADNKDTALYKGVELIYQKMLKVLQAQDVRPFETVGKQFDVHYHDALLQTPRKGVAPHIILEEVEKGYLYHDKVLRHAKVIVSADAGDEQEVDAAGKDEKADES